VTAPQSVFPLRSSTGVALVAGTVLASTVGFLNAYMINVAVPAIGRDLDADVSAIQWVLTGYLVTVAALLLVAGALADHFGRRRILVVGLFIMLVAALGCAAAPNAAVLVVARLVQGVGGALVVPSSLAMLNGALIPVDRARGIGIWAGLSTLGVFLRIPVIGLPIGVDVGPYVLLYALGAAVMVGIVSTIIIIVMLIPVGGIGAAIVLGGKAVGLTWNLYTITLAVVAGAILLLLVLYAISFVSVPTIVFFPAYSLYFFASRYPALHAVLHPAPPEAPPMAPPLPPAPEPIG